MKEKFPNLAKETDMQVQESHRVPKKWDLRKNEPGYIIIKLPKTEDKEFESSKRKGDSYLQRSSH